MKVMKLINANFFFLYFPKNKQINTFKCKTETVDDDVS